MTSHHACIGITGEQEFLQIVNASNRRKSKDGIDTLWTDSSGARLAAHVSEGSIKCSHPSFDGSTVLVGRVLEQFQDEECPHCYYLRLEFMDERAEPVYVQLVLLEKTIPPPEMPNGTWVEVRAVGFAEEFAVFVDTDDYWRKKASLAPIGPRWLVHAGTFKNKDGVDSRTSHVLVTGAIKEIRDHLNTSTSTPFHTVIIESYAYDMELVVAAQDIPPSLQPGKIVQAKCWVVARVEPTDRRSGPSTYSGGGVAFGGVGREYFDGLPGEPTA